MKIEEEPYRGYRAHIEYGAVVWYKTTRTKSVGKSIKTGKEIRVGTAMDRVVTTAETYEEAQKQLDRYLSKPKAPPKMDTSGNMKLEF